MLVQILEAVVRLPEQRRQGFEAPLRAALADLEEDPLRTIDGNLGVVRLLVADRGDLARRRDQVAEDRLALDDATVVLNVDRGRHRVHQAGQVRRSPDLVEPIPPCQLVPQRDEVDRLALSVEREHRLEDVTVLLAIEVRGVQEVRDAQDRLRVDEDGAEDALLRLDSLG